MKIFFFLLFCVAGNIFCSSLEKETVLSLSHKLLLLEPEKALESLKKIENLLVASKKEKVEESVLRSIFKILNKGKEKTYLREKASKILLWLREHDRTSGLYWAFRDFYKNHQERYLIYKSLRDSGGQSHKLSKVLKWM